MAASLAVELNREALVLAVNLLTLSNVARVRLKSYLPSGNPTLTLSDLLVTPATRTEAEAVTVGTRISTDLGAASSNFEIGTFDVDLSLLTNLLSAVPVATVTIVLTISATTIQATEWAALVLYGSNSTRIVSTGTKVVP